MKDEPNFTFHIANWQCEIIMQIYVVNHIYVSFLKVLFLLLYESSRGYFLYFSLYCYISSSFQKGYFVRSKEKRRKTTYYFP